MGYILVSLLGLCLLGMGFCIMMLVRNSKVYHSRLRILYEDRAKYDRLPSYNRMMLEFWKPIRKYEFSGRD